MIGSNAIRYKNIALVILIIILFFFAFGIFYVTNPQTIRLSNKQIAFSFKIPRNWAVETRHSGERNLSIEEMREFLSTCHDGGYWVADKIYPDYCDLPLSKIKQLSPTEIEKLFFRSTNDWLPYPTASVADAKYISYSDTAWQQIDFYIFRDFYGLNNYFTQIRSDKTFLPNSRSIETIAGRTAYIINFPTDKDENNKEIITKNGTGGKIFYIPLNAKDMLVINKQAKGDSHFEKKFNELLHQLKITI